MSMYISAHYIGGSILIGWITIILAGCGVVLANAVLVPTSVDSIVSDTMNILNFFLMVVLPPFKLLYISILGNIMLRQ